MDKFGLDSAPEPAALCVRAREAAAMLGISEKTLTRIRKRGEIRSVTLSDSCVVYTMEDLKKLLANGMKGGVHAAY